MKRISDTTKFQILENTVVAIGKFDGFHVGHQELLDRLQHMKNKGFATVVFTFVPSPSEYFSGEKIKELSTVEEKRRIFERAGVDYLIEYPFFKDIADMEPERYIKDILVGMINAKCVVAGDDVSFGKGGKGNSQLLEDMVEKYGYATQIIDKVSYNGREISSTYVREEVRKGNMEMVKKLLGTPYHIGGEIVHGRKLGRTIGMPTVNQLPVSEKLLPPNGVYYSYVYLNGAKHSGKKYYSITNIGTKPTVDGSAMGVETYIYDFNDDVYGEDMEVFLLSYKRPEMKFNGVDELKKQMQKDIMEGRLYHGI